jgi:hypothetical protein
MSLGSAASAQEPASVQGRVLRGVVADSSGTRIGFANVQMGNSMRRIVTNEAGEFTMSGLPNGPVRVTVRRIGFAPRDIAFEAVPDSVVTITLDVTARVLGERVITTSATREDKRGFYQRMADVQKGINHGYFVTPEEIEMRKPGMITQMVEGIPGVKVLRSPRNPRMSSIHGTQRAGMTAEPCKMTVYLDGIRITNTLYEDAEGIDELVHSRSIAGIEIYPRSVGTPPQYQPLNGSCGVVLFWTK